MVAFRKFLLAGTVACMASMAGAQTGDPVDIVDAAARERGDLSQVLVLGTSHLSSLPGGFDRSRFDPLLDRLETWKPDTVVVEGLSGAQCDYLHDYEFAYPETAETYCPDTAPAREALGIGPSDAEAQALGLLAEKERSASDSRHLAALFLAIGEPDSALLQWLLLPEAERRADGVLTQPLVDQIVARGKKMSENTLIAVPLALRLGLQRIYPVDDHTGDRATGPVDDETFGKDISAAWDNAANTERLPMMEGWETSVVAGEKTVLDWYRDINGPDQARLAMTGDFGAAAEARSEANSGRAYLAYWETRNLRMVANIREVIGPKARVLAVVGVSHKPYYERYLGMTSDVEIANVDAVLEPDRD